jgi:hypothetical protein
LPERLRRRDAADRGAALPAAVARAADAYPRRLWGAACRPQDRARAHYQIAPE